MIEQDTTIEVVFDIVKYNVIIEITSLATLMAQHVISHNKTVLLHHLVHYGFGAINYVII